MDGISDIIRWAVTAVGVLVGVGVALLAGFFYLRRKTAMRGG
jgi:hypothetical protein